MFEKGNECYMLDSYGSDRDCVKVYKDKIRIAMVPFEIGMNLNNEEFFYVVSMGKYFNEILSKIDKNITLIYIKEFNKKLIEFVTKVHCEAKRNKKQQENEWSKYKNSSGWDDMFGNTSTKSKSIDIFNADEQKLIKEILDDKELWKKVYRSTAMKMHSDRVATQGEKAVHKSEEKMKLLNAINDKINKDIRRC